MEIFLTQEFKNNFLIYSRQKKSLVKKIKELKSEIELNWFNLSIFERYDVKSLGWGFFRIRFIPFRLVLKIENERVVFFDFFKRKWWSDYKKYV